MNQEYYEPQGEIYAPETGNTSVSNLSLSSLSPIALEPANNRLARKAEKRVAVVAVQERAKARVASDVILNTVALSAIVDQAAQMVPSSEAPCRHIVNTYASSSAQKIAEARWW
ncbi:hypothetical protein FACS1894132_02290 [Clostridia bacterium]|nr:hypothetical protein FACS1894132_02290 [Clostridia bacterium]